MNFKISLGATFFALIWHLIKKIFAIFSVNFTYEIFCSDIENKITTIKIFLKRNTFPYFLTHISLIGFDNTYISSYHIQTDEKELFLGKNQLTFKRKTTQINQLIKHYGKNDIVITIEIPYSKLSRRTLGLLFKREINYPFGRLKYISIPAFEDLQNAV